MFMSKKKRNLLIAVCLVIVIAVVILLTGGAQSFREKYEGTDLSTDVSSISREGTYDGYLALYPDCEYSGVPISTEITEFTGDGTVTGNGVFQKDGDRTTWTFTVEEAGLYNIRIGYLTTESRGVDIERAVYINDELPFTGAATIRFSRIWTDAGEVTKDNQGNDIRPSQVEIYTSQQAYCIDDKGYNVDPYRFYFKTGENTVTLEAVNETVIIQEITLMPVVHYPTYSEYAASQPAADMSSEALKYSQIVEGEDALRRSSPSLYARYDHSSPDTQPYSVTNTVLNYIGGDPWNTAGSWIEWDFEVPEDGYYEITVKARQPYQRGALSCRSVYIDGEIPFEELKSVSFSYDTSWKLYTLSDDNGKAFRFYLTKGAHTIRMTATLGEMGDILKRIEDSIFRLNQIYRKVLVLTGANPDRFRDYNLKGVYPDVIEAMDLESKRLYKLIDDTVAITGQKSDRVASLQTLAVQLESFIKKNDRITQSFTNFRDNITSLGTAMQNMAESKLDVDYIVISGEKATLPKVHDNAFNKLIHEIRACVASYFVDYNSLGDKYDEDDDNLIEVWIVTGRDQSTILKTMVDDSFTRDSGIKVNVKLVAADALLTAVVAGNGPDVVLSVDGWFAANYAMRNAVEDLTQFDDYEQVVAPFVSAAIEPLTYNDGTKKGVYGLPETQVFPVLFYRSDILEELGLSVPETWDDLIAMLPTLQGNNMSVGISFPEIVSSDISVLNSMIYQNGGAIYEEDDKRTVIDSEAGVAAFKLYTSLYNDYGLPTVFDFNSRFRSGEMPVGVSMYTTYNTLAVSAPEIRGLWKFTMIPGTRREDGTIDRSSHSNVACCMMIATDDENVKNNAWEFMKWWVSTDTQVRFGREMESVLGSSARYSTANTEALKQLAWSGDELAVLLEQQSHTVGFREVAGGYSTTRHITNAIRKVINDKSDPRETLLTYVRTINEEIRIKRTEFGLELD